MANERLRAVMHSTGITTQRLAAELGVDPKTVERWVTRDTVPHRTTAFNAARLLGSPMAYVWPALASRAAAPENEVIGLYPHRHLVPRSLWFDLLKNAQREIVVMAYASLFLPEDNPESVRLLAEKAESGVRVRLALGDPDSPEVAQRGAEEGLGEALAGRVRMAVAYYRPLLDVVAVDFRLHRTTLYNSVFVYDDEMLVNQHAYGVYGYLAPVLHLRRHGEDGLFGMYAGSFERVWERAYPCPR
ncbi:XRE family transcriptional regulator [Catellatospora methionotrophica]|uniref:XRE family transcriptional regulator n=1 Tax=Catellatospora methionotrophica TaxID=121620 RepID=UPI00340C6518